MKVGTTEYSRLHLWLIKTFGKASRCENPYCEKTNINFQWAKIKGMEYEYKRENFKMLCKKCHLRYDLGGRKSIQNKTKYKESKMDKIKLAKAIKHLRDKLFVEQKELAATLGVSRSAISHYEMGLRLPNKPVLRRLFTYAKANGVDLYAIMGDDSDGMP